MELQKLFETQEKLDERIVKEKGLEGQDLLDKKILSLQVELGELANEHRGFKFWSKNQEPRKIERTPFECGMCEGSGFDDFLGEDCEECDGEGLSGEYNEEYPLLEEYVDCLHFILSIGVEWNLTNNVYEKDYFIDKSNLVYQFSKLFQLTSDFLNHDKYGSYYDVEDCYNDIITEFKALGEMLGFTEEQIEQAYYSKNQINHDRQGSGY